MALRDLPETELHALSGRTLFRMRMQREGREPAFDELITTYTAAGQNKAVATMAAMRDLGYKGPPDERRKYSVAVSSEKIAARRKKQFQYERDYRARKRAARDAAKGDV